MIAREGYVTILVVLTVGVAGWAAAALLPEPAGWVLRIALLTLLLLVIYFFRDPDRHTQDRPGLIVAPADGRVVVVKEVQEPHYLKGTATQVSIFLSPLDVHVNRVPATGKLEFVEYIPGLYKMAWEDHASELNERAHFGMLLPGGEKLLFKQITGFLARRIVYHIREGDDLKAGQRFGIMKFGSRMDLLLPPGTLIHVREGDRTVAGESVIGELKS